MNEGLKAYLRVPFVMIVWVMETYTKNRERVKSFMAKPRTAQVFKTAVVLTALVWIVIGLTANEEQGQRFTDAVKNFWTETQSLSDEKRALQSGPETAQ